MTLSEHIANEPMWLQAWVTWLTIVNLAALVFAVQWRDGGLRPGPKEAFAIIAALVAVILVMEWLYSQVGYVRLLGLAHVLVWTPLAYYLWTRLDQHPWGTAFGAYLRVFLITIGISLVIDYIDVARYLAGDGELG